MSDFVYADHKARADAIICDALASTDSAGEKAAILKAFRDALSAFEVPVPADATPTPADATATADDSTDAAKPARKGKKAATADAAAPEATE